MGEIYEPAVIPAGPAHQEKTLCLDRSKRMDAMERRECLDMVLKHQKI